MGHDDPARVTKADIIAWKDKLLAAGLSARGIKYGHLAAPQAIYNRAMANGILLDNPFLGVTIPLRKKAGTKMLSYTNDEVARILALAEGETKPDRRWLPWLMALSGARVGELVQLWGRRIVNSDGVWMMKIAPAEDGGTLKNEGSERDVPIHPAVLERGFFDFVKSRGDGPLFYRDIAGGYTHFDTRVDTAKLRANVYLRPNEVRVEERQALTHGGSSVTSRI